MKSHFLQDRTNITLIALLLAALYIAYPKIHAKFYGYPATKFFSLNHPCGKEIRQHCGSLPFERKDAWKSFNILACLTTNLKDFSNGSPECGSFRRRKAGQLDHFHEVCAKDAKARSYMGGCKNGNGALDCLVKNRREISNDCRDNVMAFVDLEPQ